MENTKTFSVVVEDTLMTVVLISAMNKQKRIKIIIN